MRKCFTQMCHLVTYKASKNNAGEKLSCKAQLNLPSDSWKAVVVLFAQIIVTCSHLLRLLDKGK